MRRRFRRRRRAGRLRATMAPLLAGVVLGWAVIAGAQLAIQALGAGGLYLYLEGGG